MAKKKNNGLLYCPFCGKRASIEVLDYNNIGMIVDNEEEHLELKKQRNYTVCCSVFNKGCGAHSGYGSTEQDAIKNWNMRKRRWF